MPTIEPFVRWAGGKTWLISYIPQILGDLHFEHYHEPFLGGGAIFFSLEHRKKAYLSDANPRLINTYLQVRDNPEELIEHFIEMTNDEASYYRIREDFCDENSPENAARFLFLNQTSFNGLFRVNREGRYNVPYGFRNNWAYDPMLIVFHNMSTEAYCYALL